MQVIRTVAASRLLLLLPLVAAVLPVLDARRQRDQEGQDTHSPRSDGHVQHRDAELVGAVRFLFVETRRAMPGPVAPEGSTDAGVQLRAPVRQTAHYVTATGHNNKLGSDHGKKSHGLIPVPQPTPPSS